MRIPIAFFYFIAIAMFSCNSKQTAEAGNLGDNLPNDFIAFYEKFHRDSLYQIQHIRFPLEGLPADVDSATTVERDFRFYADTWIMQRTINPEKEGFIRTFEQPMAGIINETTKQKQGPYAIIRRFYQQDNEWYLIYYMDMNKIE